MSDPVTNAEIEDVLSSIRRLVSDEPLSAKARKQSNAPANDSFLLTPALRVMEEAERASRTDDQQPEEAQEKDTGPSLDDRADDAGDDGAQEDEMWQASGQDDVDLTEIAGPDLGPPDDPDDDAPVAEEHDDHSDVGLTVPSGAFTEEIEEQDVTPTLTLEQRIAELEAAIEQAPGEWEPDGSEEALTDETTPIGIIDKAGGPSGAPPAETLDVASTLDDIADPAPEVAEDVEPEVETPDASPADNPAPSEDHPDPEEPIQAAMDTQPEEASAEVSEAALTEDPEIDPATDAELSPVPDADAELPVLDASEMMDQVAPDEPEPVQTVDPDGQPETEAAEVFEPDDDPVVETTAEAGTSVKAQESEEHHTAQDETSSENDAWLDANEAGLEPESDVPQDIDEADPAQEPDAAEAEPEPNQHDDAQKNAGDADQAEAYQDSAEFEDEAAEPAFDLYADEALLDEEALREMVSNLVRQELQGVLGERITRNVRRLVRREIQRALAVREFD